mgnify:CR=1 FL=1
MMCENQKSTKSPNHSQSAVQTRYPKYKPSGIEWIGEIPEHWNLKRLKYEVDYKKGKNPKDLTFDEKGKAYLTMEYLRNNPKQTFFVQDHENYVAVDEGEILLLWDGSNAGEFIKSKEGVLASTMASLKICNQEIDYAWYFFKVFERQLKETTIGMGVPHVSGEEFKNQNFIIPPKSEQTAIANYLDDKTFKIDSLIEKKKKLIDLLKEKRTAIINQAVTRGIDPKVKLKPSGIDWLGEIPEHWEVKKLKYVMNSFDHIRVPISADLRGGEKNYDYYGASGVIDKVPDYLFDGDYILIGEDGANLLTRSTNLVFKATGKFWVNNHAHILKPKFGNIDFYVYLLESIDYTIWVTGSAQPKLTAENLLNVKIWFPETEEQKQIVKHIETETSRIDNTIYKIEKEIELLQEYRTALISEVVTGKIKVI